MEKKKSLKRLSIDIPDEIVTQIDRICKSSFISRRKWFIDASIEKLKRDEAIIIDMIVNK